MYQTCGPTTRECSFTYLYSSDNTITPPTSPIKFDCDVCANSLISNTATFQDIQYSTDTAPRLLLYFNEYFKTNPAYYGELEFCRVKMPLCTK